MRKKYLWVLLCFGLVQAAVAQSEVDADFSLMQGEAIGPFLLGMSVARVLKATDCVFRRGKVIEEGATGRYVSDWDSEGCGITLTMGADTPKGRQSIERINLSATGRFKTVRGIGIGNTEQEVLRLYKKEQEKDTSVAGEVFVAGSIYGGMIFSLKAGRVVNIFLGAAAE